ncbi:MAG: hypothetical protein JG775_462 [Defluviitaleaceae bacterium]|nr:hypothetical protein [Defluviitaleaceae bacterium]
MKNYENCVVQSVEYEHSDTIEMQGKRDAITKYLKKGYYIKEERNGYWVLVKPSRVMVTVESSEGTQSMNMKQDIIDYYGKKEYPKPKLKNLHRI